MTSKAEKSPKLGWFRSATGPSAKPAAGQSSPGGTRAKGKLLGFLGSGKSDYVDPRPAYQASLEGREDYPIAVLIPNKGLYVLSVLAFAPAPIIEPQSTVEYICPVYNADHYSVGLRVGAKVTVAAVRCTDKTSGFYPFPPEVFEGGSQDNTPTRARDSKSSSRRAGSRSGSRNNSRNNSKSGSRRGSAKSKARQGSNKGGAAPVLPPVPNSASSGDDDEVPPTPPPGPIRAPDVTMRDVEKVVSPALIRALTPRAGSKPATPSKQASDVSKAMAGKPPFLDIEPEHDSEPESDTSPLPVPHATTMV